MKIENSQKYIKHELSYNLKQKLLKISNKNNIDPENIILIVERFFDEWAENQNEITWDTVLTFMNIKILDSRVNKMADEIIEIKKKNKEQQRVQVEYEDDYIALIELGKALESLTKV